jgi:tetratricopeptide (TPR) repeat protein
MDLRSRILARSFIILTNKGREFMKKVFLYPLTILLALSFAGCLPSFDPEAEKHFYQGIDYVREKDHQAAIEEFSMAAEIDPTYSYAYYNRALEYYRIGELESSLADYNKAMELEPDNPYWTYERAFLHLKLGYREKAIIDLERAIEIGLPSDYKQTAEETLAGLRP